MRSLRHEGIDFRQLETGEGIPFFFQHGLGADATQPQSLAGPIDGVRLISVDCRAHGETRPLGPEERISIDVFTEDLRAWMDALGLSGAVLGGISMGAAMALNFACQWPERVLGLVLVRPAWSDQPRSENVQVFAMAAAFIRKYGAQEGAVRFEESEAFTMLRRVSPDNAASLLLLFQHPRAEETVAKLERIPAYAPGHGAAAWSRLAVPTLVLGCRQDPIHPIEYARTLAAAIPGAMFEEVTSKSVSVERYAEDLRQALSGFFDRHFRRPASPC